MNARQWVRCWILDRHRWVEVAAFRRWEGDPNDARQGVGWYWYDAVCDACPARRPAFVGADSVPEGE